VGLTAQAGVRSRLIRLAFARRHAAPSRQRALYDSGRRADGPPSERVQSNALRRLPQLRRGDVVRAPWPDGRRTRFVRADLQRAGDLEAPADPARDIDVLVNNTGINPVYGPLVDLDLDAARKITETNIVSTLAWTQVAYRSGLREHGGAIVNVASIMGLSGGLFPNASYQAAKGGVVNLTRALALEWAIDGIRVNAVAPTYVDTDMTRAIFSDPERLNTVMEHTPLGRLPNPDDVAAAILYLCSDAARCVTGIVLPVDSGYLAR
jgi:NAD(P)-dependent dehydrogenase (short-subunit alcohol dehydrogenase family)